MRILCLSDLHNDRAAAVRLGAVARGARADLIASCGDIASDLEHLPSLYNALNAAWVPTVCVPGNHDGHSGYEAAVRTAGWRDLHGRVQEEAGWSLAGWGVHTDDALPSSNAAVQHEDPVLAGVIARLSEVPPDRIVLIAHVPPRGTTCAIDRRGVDRGSVQLRRWVEAFQPAFVLCGHVHHREVVLDRVGKTAVVNAGPHGHVLDLP